MRHHLPLLLLLAACSSIPDRSTYPEMLAEAQCDFDHRCAPTEFYFRYLDEPECVDGKLGEWNEIKSEYDACGFLEERAIECLEWLSVSCKLAGREYDQLRNDCDGVWNCI
jgi:hypothetical protein